MVTHSGFNVLIACTVVMLAPGCLCAGCASGQSPAQPAGMTPVPSGSPHAIAIKNFVFSPATLTVKTGTTVTWTNDDSAPHTVVSDAGSPVPFTSPELVTGVSFMQTFSQAGIYTFHCSIQPSRKGTVVVEP
jgi:plastocyanin